MGSYYFLCSPEPLPLVSDGIDLCQDPPQQLQRSCVLARLDGREAVAEAKLPERPLAGVAEVEAGEALVERGIWCAGVKAAVRAHCVAALRTRHSWEESAPRAGTGARSSRVLCQRRAHSSARASAPGTVSLDQTVESIGRRKT